MSILRRRLMMATEKSPIPPEYQLVEYLESTGTQYIGLSFPSTDARGIKIKFQALSGIQNDSCIAGHVGNNAPLVLFYNNTLWGLYINGVGVRNEFGTQYNNDIREFSINYQHSGQFLDGNNLVTTFTYQYINNDPIGLFCRYYQGRFDSIARGVRIYRAFVSLGFDEYYKLYPVYRKADNKPGMYDIVNNQFYVNQGSGEFTVGPDKTWQG